MCPCLACSCVRSTGAKCQRCYRIAPSHVEWKERRREKKRERKRDKARKECVCVRDTERKREIENARMCCKQVRETRLYIALDRTEREREKEKVNRLHYANAVQLQLTVAKNRCRYRGMLSRTPEGVFTLFFFSFGHSLFFFSFFLSRSPFRSALRLFLDSGLHPDATLE